MNDIAKQRQNAGFTQEYVALKLGIVRSSVAKWETGASLPRSSLLCRIAVLYGCPVDDLLGEAESA